MNKRKLESIMKLRGFNGADMASFLGIARNTFSVKVNEKNGAEFTQTEISILKNKLNLSIEEVDEIFFNL